MTLRGIVGSLAGGAGLGAGTFFAWPVVTTLAFSLAQSCFDNSFTECGAIAGGLAGGCWLFKKTMDMTANAEKPKMAAASYIAGGIAGLLIGGIASVAIADPGMLSPLLSANLNAPPATQLAAASPVPSLTQSARAAGLLPGNRTLNIG